MLLEITDDLWVMCPRAGIKVSHDDICCPPSDDEDYDGYDDCPYYDGFTKDGTGMWCNWPGSAEATREGVTHVK